MVLKYVKIRSYEKGLYFRDGEFKGLLDEGRYWFLDPLGKVRVDVVSQRAPWLVHEKLDMIVKSGELGEQAMVLDQFLLGGAHQAFGRTDLRRGHAQAKKN